MVADGLAIWQRSVVAWIIETHGRIETAIDAVLVDELTPSLRHKLENDPALPKIFVTETGVGYRVLGVLDIARRITTHRITVGAKPWRNVAPAEQ